MTTQKNKTDGKTSQQLNKLPEAEEGDINYILNTMPKVWDLNTPFGMMVLEKMRDTLIYEVNKLKETAKLEAI